MQEIYVNRAASYWSSPMPNETKRLAYLRFGTLQPLPLAGVEGL